MCDDINCLLKTLIAHPERTIIWPRTMLDFIMSLPADYRKIDDEVAVSGQISPEQVADIKAAGYKSIICNRPDGEDAEQPNYELIEAAAVEAGIAIRFIPVTKMGMTQENIEDTRTALDDLERPIYAYCRSGARSTNLYGMAINQS